MTGTPLHPPHRPSPDSANPRPSPDSADPRPSPDSADPRPSRDSAGGRPSRDERRQARLLAEPGRSRPASWLYAAATTNPPPGREPDFLTRWIVITRAAVLPMTLFAGLVAILLGVRQTGFSWLDAVLAVVGITLAHTSNNMMNDLFDTQVGLDTADYPRALYAPHPILTGLVSKQVLYGAIAFVNLADLAIMLVLLDRRGWPVLAFALAGFALSYAYTAPPLRLKKIGLGEPDVFVTWGPLMVAGTYYSAVGHLPWQVWVASVPYGLLCTSVLMGKHIDKIPYDAPTGTRTLPVLLGEVRAVRVTQWLLIAFYLTLVVAVAVGALPWPALLALAGIPMMAKVSRGLAKGRPAEPPAGFPLWPLWFAAILFLHVRRAGGLLVLGLLIAAVAGIGY